MTKLRDAYNAEMQPAPVAATTEPKMRHLISPELAERFEEQRDSFARLYAGEHIDHGPNGGSVAWRVRMMLNAAGEIMGSQPVATVEGLPAWHLGVCFECSGFGAPEGWSQIERKERYDADRAAFTAEHGEGTDAIEALLRRGQGGGFDNARNLVKREEDGTKIKDWRNDPRNAGKAIPSKRRKRGRTAYT